MVRELRSTAAALALLIVLVGQSAQAYSFAAGDWLLRPIAGWSVNVVRGQTEGSESPSSGMLLGVDAEYAVDRYFGVTMGVHPNFASGFIDTALLGGVKYRFAYWEMPFVPYVETGVTLAFLAPLTAEHELHTNLGVRPAIGFDYFVLHDLAIGFAVAVEPSVAFAQTANQFELAVELALGIAWRL
ncbi:MAG: hypothetical protein AAF471_03625 [Myxococcota bacterium]